MCDIVRVERTFDADFPARVGDRRVGTSESEEVLAKCQRKSGFFLRPAYANLALGGDHEASLPGLNRFCLKEGTYPKYYR
jgi:arginase family enzyme